MAVKQVALRTPSNTREALLNHSRSESEWGGGSGFDPDAIAGTDVDCDVNEGELGKLSINRWKSSAASS